MKQIMVALLGILLVIAVLVVASGRSINDFTNDVVNDIKDSKRVVSCKVIMYTVVSNPNYARIQSVECTKGETCYFPASAASLFGATGELEIKVGDRSVKKDIETGIFRKEESISICAKESENQAILTTYTEQGTVASQISTAI